MIEKWRHIGEEIVKFRMEDEEAARITRTVLGEMFAYRSGNGDAIADMTITIRSGYGSRRSDTAPASVVRDERGLSLERRDFQLRIAVDDWRAEIRFYDSVGLQAALLSWYSTMISRAEWGMAIRSSCVVNDGKAYLFVGASDDRRSAIASLSRPCVLLSDEVSLVRIGSEAGARVYDSPFRTFFKEPADVGFAALHRIYLLKRSPVANLSPLPKGEAMLMVLNEVVQGTRDAGETAGFVRMCKRLIEQVPVCEMEVRQNGALGEAIS